MSQGEFEVDKTAVERRREVLQRQARESQREQAPPASLPSSREHLQQGCTQVDTGKSGNPTGSQRQHSRKSALNSEVIEDISRGATGLQSTDALELPLTEYIALAAQRNTRELAACKNWQGPSWTFCRYMKSRPELRDLTSDQAADIIDEQLREMFPDSRFPWMELLGGVDSGGNPHNPFDHFIECWDSVKCELGEAPLEKALRLAEEHPLELPGHRSPAWEHYRRFLSICRWLQVTGGEDRFYIPVNLFSDLLGKPKSSVSHYRKRGEREGYLIKLREHRGRGEAAEFRFNLDGLRREDEDPSNTEGENWGEIS